MWGREWVNSLEEGEQAEVLTNGGVQKEGQSGQANLCGEGERSENRKKGSD